MTVLVISGTLEISEVLIFDELADGFEIYGMVGQSF